MSHCFCFKVMSRSLVSSRISSRVKKCISPFWCLVWDLNTETLYLQLLFTTQRPTLNPWLVSNFQNLAHSLGLAVHRRHTKHITQSGKLKLRSGLTHETNGQNLVAFYPALLPLDITNERMTNTQWLHMVYWNYTKNSRSRFLIFHFDRKKWTKMSSETYLHVIDYFG